MHKNIFTSLILVKELHVFQWLQRLQKD